jgi:hypothetical protein
MNTDLGYVARGMGVQGYVIQHRGVRFTAKLQEMAASEILEMVGADTLRDIKAEDPNPLIKAFVVGHEGDSRGNLVGVGNVVKRWLREMIHALGKSIHKGIQLFSGHNATSDNAGRTAIGKVAGSKIKEIDGRESIVVACHIYPDYRHLPLDVASIETSVDFVQREDGTIEIVKVDDVTGIALGNSRVDTPGFPGATLLGQLQAFELQNKQTDESRLRLGYSTKVGQPQKLRLV